MTKKEIKTKERILWAALQLFLEHGYKDVSYEMLIKKTGLSKGAIYHHFDSKNDLLLAVFNFFYQQSVSRAEMISKIEIKNFKALRKHFMELLVKQMADINKFLNIKSIKINRLLFFAEAMNEDARLAGLVGKMYLQEMRILEIYFTNMKEREGLLKNGTAQTWAEILFLKLQAAEMKFLFSEGIINEKAFIAIYNKAFDEFEKIFRV